MVAVLTALYASATVSWSGASVATLCLVGSAIMWTVSSTLTCYVGYRILVVVVVVDVDLLPVTMDSYGVLVGDHLRRILR